VADEGQVPRNWRLDRIADVAVADQAAIRPDGFSLQDYADQSFGIFHDDTADVVLRVTPSGAEDALRWRFHAHQSVEAEADGSVLVRFRASGMLELAWHLFTWGDKIQVLSPPGLKSTLAEQIEIARRTHASGSVVPSA
jgi:predicted DNA-binding transcriptional regulator YafY